MPECGRRIFHPLVASLPAEINIGSHAAAHSWRPLPVMEWSGRAPAPPASWDGQQIKRDYCHDGRQYGKNSFHVVGLDLRDAIVLRQKWSRGQVEARLANIPRCLIAMEACVRAHHLSRKLQSLGHDTRLMPARYVRANGESQ